MIIFLLVGCLERITGSRVTSISYGPWLISCGVRNISSGPWLSGGFGTISWVLVSLNAGSVIRFSEFNIVLSQNF